MFEKKHLVCIRAPYILVFSWRDWHTATKHKSHCNGGQTQMWFNNFLPMRIKRPSEKIVRCILALCALLNHNKWWLRWSQKGPGRCQNAANDSARRSHTQKYYDAIKVRDFASRTLLSLSHLGASEWQWQQRKENPNTKRLFWSSLNIYLANAEESRLDTRPHKLSLKKDGHTRHKKC